jgi:hypothetical protein
MQSKSHVFPAVVAAGISAGVAGAIAVDAYLIGTLVALAHTVSVEAFYRYVGAIGPAAYAESGGAYLGVAIHVIVSLAWAIGYAYVAARTPQVLARPLVSGIAFGFVVMISMQLVEVAAGIYKLPNTFSLANDIIAHVLFFGLPVAYIVRGRLRA